MAGVRFYKDGDSIGLETELATEESFLDAAASGLQRVVMNATDEQEQAYLLRRYTELIVEVCCKLRGYKSAVTVRQLIAAGNVLPSAMPINVEVNDRHRVTQTP